MPRDTKGDAAHATAAENRAEIKRDFGRRVYRLMLARGMNQSDLARVAGLERNRVSTYVRGRCLPTGTSLYKLAAALGVEATVLLPDARLDGDDDELFRNPATTPYAMTVLPGGKSMRITADVLVPTPVGVQIIQLLSDNAVANGE